MKRALELAERNKILENELRDIDQMALAVEAECNDNVKANADKLEKLKSTLQETFLQLQTAERQVEQLKREKTEISSDLDVAKQEKKCLQRVLETALEEKKRLTEKLNKMCVIERDLNSEIDRLVQCTAAQKRKIADLECQQITDNFRSSGDAGLKACEQDVSSYYIFILRFFRASLPRRRPTYLIYIIM